MPSFVQRDTAAVLGTNAEKCDSRSLLLDKFADPTAKKDARKSFFERFVGLGACSQKLDSWQMWLIALKSIGQSQKLTLLYAQLKSRLIINGSGGIMENAGLCLDRFGLPYIPGSAAKGCARHAAIHALAETKSPPHKAELACKICLVFGWSETDWKQGRNKNGEPFSDLWWAMASSADRTSDADAERNTAWRDVAGIVANRLLNQLGVQQRKFPDEPWRDLPSYAGSVCFLQAYPLRLSTAKLHGLPIEDIPAPSKLDLDVVTCHHKKYYAGDLQTAADVEEPNPVIFPAIAPGHVFGFPILPLRHSDPDLLSLAKSWLATGLSVFGLGAKTNAGYGWFECTDEIQGIIENQVQNWHRQISEEKRRQIKEQQLKAEEEARLQRKRERESLLAGLPPEQRADKEIEMLTDDQFKEKVRNFCKDTRKGGPTDEQKKAIVRALRGPRLAFWEQFKKQATKGELAKVANAIRELSKAMNLGKMP